MIVIEFLIFVVSSGLFCSERFRNHLWAVLVAGAIATGSSLLFFYHVGVKMMGPEPTPAIITKIVKVPVVKTVLPSQSAALSKDRPHTCGDQYPAEAQAKGEEGATKVGFRILTDGTVEDVRVVTSSGSMVLDEAAVKCVTNWHYRPAIKDGKLAEVASSAMVKWVLPTAADAKAETIVKEEDKKDEKKPEDATPVSETANDGHHWYDPRGWFGGEPEKKPQAGQPQP